jgi:hypothetical protein
MAKHFIGMAGLAGYLPNFAEAYETREDATWSLLSIHELDEKSPKGRDLVADGYVSLDIHEDGNEYAEVIECAEGDTLEDHEND